MHIKHIMNTTNPTPRYSINLSFEEIKLPPFRDILVLGKNSSQGKIGLLKSFELLVPNGFEAVEIGEGNVEAVFISRKILTKMPLDKVVGILRSKVFDFISDGELLKVDFRVAVSYNNIEEV